MSVGRWVRPDPRVMKSAVGVALSDLHDLGEELLRTDREYTTGERAELVNHWGICGATRKRQAEVDFLTGSVDWVIALRAARDDYGRGLQPGNYRDHWLLCQFVVLRSVLDWASQQRRESDGWWDDACRAVRGAMRTADPMEKMWAESSLADLRMVALREGWPIEGVAAESSPLPALERMVHYGGGGEQCPAVWPTFRQFWRWRTWWCDPAWAPAAEEGYQYLWRFVRPTLESTAPTIERPPSDG